MTTKALFILLVFGITGAALVGVIILDAWTGYTAREVERGDPPQL